MKKNTLFTIIGCAISFCMATSLVSCEDELSSKELKIYTMSPTGGNMFKTQIVHPEAQGGFTAKVPVRSTRELVADATIHFEVDNSLIDAYNEAHGTNLQPLPEEMYNVVNLDLKLARGLQSSEDSVELNISDVTKLRDESGYLVPIQMKEIDSEDKGLEISSNMNTIYVVFNVAIRRMYNADSFDATLMDRTNWVITPDCSNITQGNCDQLKDNNYRTGIFKNREEYTFIVDLQSSKTLKGFRFTPMYNNSYDLSAIEVSYSDDNATWTDLGYHELKGATGSAAGSNCGYQFVGLYDPVKARYVKIISKIAGTSFYNYTGIGELDLFE